jgi:hypothetical protein
MTSFVHVEQPAAHPGVTRAEAAFDHFRSAAQGVDGSRGLAALLLAAIVSALLIVADKLVSNLNEGGLLAAWLVMWAVAFVALAFFAGTARTLALRATAGWSAYARRRAAAQADARFLAYAQYDARVMNDIQAAVTRQEAVTGTPAKVPAQLSRAIVAQRSADVKIPTLYEAMRRVNLGKYY